MSIQKSPADAAGLIESAAAEEAAELNFAQAQQSQQRMRRAFRQVDLQALRVSVWLRAGTLMAIGVWVTLVTTWPGAVFYWVALAGFMVIGFLQHAAAKRDDGVTLFGLILVDFLLLSLILTVDNPLMDGSLPPGEKLRQSREVHYFVLLAGVAACYQPRRVIWAGFCAMASWTLAFLWIASGPDVSTSLNAPPVASFDEWAVMIADPNFVDFERLYQGLVVMAIVTAILAAVVARARNMVRAQILSARARANLSRYFAPAIVDELAVKDDAFDVVTEHSAAVLFADVVGFTAMSDGEPPERVIGFLRALHHRLEKAIFDNGGTLDKYMGDGVMAIFGTPHSGPDDACRAIAAARAIQTAVAEWNKTRAAAGFPPVRLSVGVHYGPVVTGDIGSERRLEFATIGDAVNLASRLESATRGIGALVLISNETAIRAAAEDVTRAEGLLRGFAATPQLQLPGHSPVDALALARL